MTRHTLLTALLLTLLVWGVTSETSAQVTPPASINYQGWIAAADGEPITDGQYKVAVRLYDSSDGITPVWGPKTFEAVPVSEGSFNIVLGPEDDTARPLVDALTKSETETSTRFVGVTINDGPEIQPRHMLLSVPFAVNAARLNGYPGTWYVPPGAIMAYWGTTAPDGWLLCDGAQIPTGDRYTALRDIVGVNTPDMRGLFLRGANNGRSDEWRDQEERTVGSLQHDMLKEHTHSGVEQSTDPHFSDGGNTRGTSDRMGHSDNRSGSTGTTGGAETRPKNIAVNYIIKY